MRGHLELMGDDPEEQREAIAIAIDELDRLERMVEEMNLLAKSERPDFVRPSLVALEDFTNSLYDKAKTLGERDWQLAAVANGRLWADPQRLSEAIFNLVQNAVEHTQVGDRITLGSVLEADTVKFWVRDAGPGIAPELQERIFERFVRIGKTTTHASGAGLGLSIVRAIAEAHGGRVELSSQLGGGAFFAIVIPQIPAPLALSFAGEREMNRILIAEDEPRIISFLEKGLQANGFTTTHAATAAEALQLANSEDFDLLVLDLGLPGKDGLEVLRELRGRGERLPVLILSARDDLDSKVAGLDVGANDYVTKPFRFEELLARVRARLRDRQAPRSANRPPTILCGPVPNLRS